MIDIFKKNLLLIFILSATSYAYGQNRIVTTQKVAEYPAQQLKQLHKHPEKECVKYSNKETSLQDEEADSSRYVKAALKKIDDLFETVPYWLATVYDSETGGFYDNYTMKISEGFAPDIQSTYFGWSSLVVDGYVFEELNAVPKVIRKRVINFMQSRQDSLSGYFFDPQYRKKIEKSERTKGRILGMAVLVLRSSGADPLYPLPGEKELNDRPQFLKSTKTYKEWLRKQDWNHIWSAFDRILSQAETIRSLPESLRDSVVSLTYSYAKKHQNKDGLWGEGQSMADRIGGINKLGGFLNKLHRSLPNPDQAYKTIIKWLETSPPVNAQKGGCSICVPRNTVRALYYLRPYLSHPMSSKDKLTIINQTFRFMKYFKLPDGGFPKTLKEFVFAPNDIHMGSTSIKQSDMNGTHLMINARFSLYKLLQIPMPALPNRHAFMNFLPNYKFSK